MKRKNIILLSLIFIFAYMRSVYGNPIIPLYPTDIFSYTLILVGFFLAGVSIELVIIILFIRKNKLHQNYKIFYKTVLIVNLFTFIATQLFALFLIGYLRYYGYSVLYYFLIYLGIEFLPIFFEILIFMKIYRFLNQTNSFRTPIKHSTAIISTITANLVTFFIGAVIFYYFPFIYFRI